MDLTGKSYEELLALYLSGQISKAQFAAAYVSTGDGLDVTVIGAAPLNWPVIAIMALTLFSFLSLTDAQQHH